MGKELLGPSSTNKQHKSSCRPERRTRAGMSRSRRIKTPSAVWTSVACPRSTETTGPCLLVVPETSHLFSTAGNEMTNKRTRLKCDNFETLVDLNEVWPKYREWEARKNFKAVCCFIKDLSPVSQFLLPFSHYFPRPRPVPPPLPLPLPRPTPVQRHAAANRTMLDTGEHGGGINVRRETWMGESHRPDRLRIVLRSWLLPHCPEGCACKCAFFRVPFISIPVSSPS